MALLPHAGQATVDLDARRLQALKMLVDPSPQEREILGAIRYAPNVAYLHRDPKLMPRRKRARLA